MAIYRLVNGTYTDVDFTGYRLVNGVWIEGQAAGGDTTAPILTLPTGIKTGSTTGSGTVTTDEANGQLDYLVDTNATRTAAQIIAGTTFQAVTTTGIQNVTVTGLTPSTLYYLHYVHTDAATNESNVVNSAGFTTDAAAPTFQAAWARQVNQIIQQVSR